MFKVISRVGQVPHRIMKKARRAARLTKDSVVVFRHPAEDGKVFHLRTLAGIVRQDERGRCVSRPQYWSFVGDVPHNFQSLPVWVYSTGKLTRKDQSSL